MASVPRQLRVLITEDDPDTRELLSLCLAQHRFEVVFANNGEDALRLDKKQQLDAYLIDNRLPQLCGVELCRRIRQFDLYTPIIFYSGDANSSQKEEALLAGAQGYVVKPASCDEVLEALLAVVKRL